MNEVPSGRPPASDEVMVAEALREVFTQVGITNPLFRRLILRVEQLGSPIKDEVQAFKVLQRACTEEAALAEALVARGLADPRAFDPRQITTEGGRLVQGFTRFLDDDGVRWIRKGIAAAQQQQR
ncbi:MAG: hypothetical protein R3A52_29755 [Polyangiales bacterium]